MSRLRPFGLILSKFAVFSRSNTDFTLEKPVSSRFSAIPVRVSTRGNSVLGTVHGAVEPDGGRADAQHSSPKSHYASCLEIEKAKSA